MDAHGKNEETPPILPHLRIAKCYEYWLASMSRVQLYCTKSRRFEWLKHPFYPFLSKENLKDTDVTMICMESVFFRTLGFFLVACCRWNSKVWLIWNHSTPRESTQQTPGTRVFNHWIRTLRKPKIPMFEPPIGASHLLNFTLHRSLSKRDGWQVATSSIPKDTKSLNLGLSY